MKDVVIIGGGIAGLISAVLLSKAGLEAVVLEKKEYPYHKVCGEYISNEVRGFLQSIDAFPAKYLPSEITHTSITSQGGNVVNQKLDLGGFGISRYHFDLHLSHTARLSGAEIRPRTSVTGMAFQDNHFDLEISTQEKLKARVVIGAFGKRSNLDRILNRPFFQKTSPYMGVKYHKVLDFPENTVALYNFQGGYCGIVKIEEDRYNLCYLVHRKYLKKYGSIDQLEAKHLCSNSSLMPFLLGGKNIYEKPQVINEISFDSKSIIDEHILMSGDAAGMITPLCGNGMAIAVHTGKMLAEEIISFFHIHGDRQKLESEYTRKWKTHFQRRLITGRKLQTLFNNSFVSDLTLQACQYFPSITQAIVKRTHGKSIPFNEDKIKRG